MTTGDGSGQSKKSGDCARAIVRRSKLQPRVYHTYASRSGFQSTEFFVSLNVITTGSGCGTHSMPSYEVATNIAAGSLGLLR